MKNILCACEESQAICLAFRNLGFNAFSCDLQECSGGHPEYHFQSDCFDVIENKGGVTMTGEHIYVDKWDLVTSNPPCTYLTRVSQRYCNESKYGEYATNRQHLRDEAIDFFMRCTEIDAPHLAIENPLGIMSRLYREPDQIIQPWQFSRDDNVQKSTCLWLKGLPALTPKYAERLDPDVVEYTDSKGLVRKQERFFYETRFLPADERRRQRSKTFQGIARAMAEQWSSVLLDES